MFTDHTQTLHKEGDVETDERSSLTTQFARPAIAIDSKSGQKLLSQSRFLPRLVLTAFSLSDEDHKILSD